MFVHTLNDRSGQAQWVSQASDEQHHSGWLRVVGRNGGSTSRDGNFEADNDATLVQGGGDIARVALGGEQGRLHLGGMLGYGTAVSDTTAAGNVARAKGETEGWSVGGYGTWYRNDNSRLGWYTDAWATYNGFKNTVQGETLPEVRYDSRALTLSMEAGYATRIGRGPGWTIEPQAQLIHIDYTEDDVTEVNGTRVDGRDGSGWISRLGLRTYHTWMSRDTRSYIQPYVAVNWWHDSVADALAFNQIALSDLYPENRYEVKLGGSTHIDESWSAWGNIGYQWGDQNFDDIAMRFGTRYSW